MYLPPTFNVLDPLRGDTFEALCPSALVCYVAVIVCPPPHPVQAAVLGMAVLGMTVSGCLKAGESVQLVCEVYGYPIPTVHFFKDNASLQQDDHTHTTTNTLTITNIGPHDGGVYSCSADNGVSDYSTGHELVYCSK